MNLQVLPLRVLVSRQVIRDRMDYTGYLAGKTRGEMDILDRLAGRFAVQASELIVERFWGGDKVPADEWEIRRSKMPRALINFLDGKAEFSISETFSSGVRMWVISDVDGLQKGFQLTSRGGLQRAGHWTHSDDFIEDGKLVTARKAFGMAGGKVALIVNLLDSFSTDEQGNVARKFVWSMPALDIKITKVMSALRVV